jgi:hypothetical protein
VGAVQGAPTVTGTVHAVVDVESDGPAPSLYSMVSLGAAVCAPPFKTTFGLKTRPISKDYVAEALAISGISRAMHETYPDPAEAVPEFVRWLKSLGGRPVMWSDNPAFDWQWVNFYLHRFAGREPLRLQRTTHRRPLLRDRRQSQSAERMEEIAQDQAYARPDRRRHRQRRGVSRDHANAAR